MPSRALSAPLRTTKPRLDPTSGRGFFSYGLLLVVRVVCIGSGHRALGHRVLGAGDCFYVVLTTIRAQALRPVLTAVLADEVQPIVHSHADLGRVLDPAVYTPASGPTGPPVVVDYFHSVGTSGGGGVRSGRWVSSL